MNYTFTPILSSLFLFHGMPGAHTVFQKGRGQQAKGERWCILWSLAVLYQQDRRSPQQHWMGLCLSFMRTDVTEKVLCKFSWEGFYTGIYFSAIFLFFLVCNVFSLKCNIFKIYGHEITQNKH